MISGTKTLTPTKMEYYYYLSLCKEITKMAKEKVVEINPFVVNNPIKVVQVNAEGTITKNAKDGVLYEGSIIKSSYYIDSAEKVNIYKHSVGYMDEFLFSKLKSKGRDLYLHIIHRLPKNQDYMQLKISKVTSCTGMSRNSVVTAIKELKTAGIIASKAQSLYWINPEFMFNGNRITFYRNIQEELLETVGKINR